MRATFAAATRAEGSDLATALLEPEPALADLLPGYALARHLCAALSLCVPAVCVGTGCSSMELSVLAFALAS